jgi:hypothetical protein
MFDHSTENCDVHFATHHFLLFLLTGREFNIDTFSMLKDLFASKKRLKTHSNFDLLPAEIMTEIAIYVIDDASKSNGVRLHDGICFFIVFFGLCNL